MPHNRATLYSNGIADFQRFYSIEGGQPKRISIPVHQQHLADVLASLTVSGNVHIDAPPSFQPENTDDGNVVISTTESFVDLVRQLVGASVEVTVANSTIAGKLIGIQGQESATEGESITKQFLVLLTPRGIRKFSVRQIENLYFTDETIRTEIDKALHRSLQQIKPNSTFVELELSTSKKSSTAVIQYTIPAAAWKISYRILLTTDAPIEFHGHAIVDNNTDEDWNDFLIAVVMGQPITFSTDLAESKTPLRSHVDVVPENALGAVEVESAMAMIAHAAPPASAKVESAAPRAMMKRSRRSSRPDSLTEETADSATIDSAEVTEMGDFCIFESSGPVSIAAHRSAIIPVFQTALEQSQSVLHFKMENHAERPFRAIQFENTTPHSLSRGVCTVYDQQTFVGNCILPTIQQGGSALLPHTMETAVRVRCQAGKIESRRTGVRLSKGVAYESYHKLLRTEYLINSQRNEPFQWVLDHTLKLVHGDVVCQLHRQSQDVVDVPLDSLKHGRRAQFDLLPEDVVKVVFVETSVARSKVRLTGDSASDEKFRVAWLYENLVEANLSLADDPAIGQCVDLQRELDEKNDQIDYARDELQRLIARQHRLRENIKAGVSGPQSARYQDDLARAEDNLIQLEEEHLPELLAERDDCRRELYQSLKALALDWSE